jgi:hypothetical protein
MKATRKLTNIILLAIAFMLAALPAMAEYPVARQRPKIAAAKQGAARVELPSSDQLEGPGNVVSVAVVLPTGKVTERIQQRLRSSELAVISSDMLADANTVKALRNAPSSPATAEPHAKLISDSMIEVQVGPRNFFIRFDVEGPKPTTEQMSDALSKLPAAIYREYDTVDAVRYDGVEFHLEMGDNTIPLSLPEITRRERAGASTQFAP